MKFKTLLLGVALLLIAFLSYAFLEEMETQRQLAAYEEPVLTVEEMERNSPADYLTVDGAYRTNLIGQWVVEGKISNKATQIKYKDAVLKVSYYSKTETLLGSEHYTIYEYYNLGGSKDFKIKSDGYPAASIIGLEVTDAVPIN